MKVSLNTLNAIALQCNSAEGLIDVGTDELVRKIGAQLGGVDEVIDLGQKYQGIVIAKIVKCSPHPDADKLQVCYLDDGGTTPDVNRGDDGLVQVVCGAPNARENITVAWLPPGSTVPESYDNDPFVLSARELRGVVSNGMLASPKELALSDNHDGILEIDGDYQPGADFAETFGLKDDVVLDIENKMFTHRPDCFSFLGIARELAGIQHKAFKSPGWYNPLPQIPGPETDVLSLHVTNELPSLVPRFTMLVIADITVAPSPVWLQVELAKLGQKSINNIVDYTNWFMLLTGQPLHAFDYDKVKARSEEEASIVVRNPKPSERIALLNGKTIDPRQEAIMIATDKELIGIGGVMGGSETEVDDNTKNIILECGTFDMYSVRRTSMAHGLFTEAVTRFTKGQSPLQNLAVLARITEEICEQAGGKVASEVIDINHVESSDMERQSLYPDITIGTGFINSRLGFDLDAKTFADLLENVECQVSADADSLTIRPPFWRTDLELREDVVEEIGRLYGYDHLPLELPERPVTPTIKDPLFSLKAQVRTTLAQAGGNELLTYSFVHGDLLSKVDQDEKLAFRVGNALSPDLQFYRLSITPSLLDKVHANIKAGYDSFGLFELGKAHMVDVFDEIETDVPKEVNSLAFVYAAQKPTSSAAYYEAKYYLGYLLDSFQAGDFVTAVSLEDSDVASNAWAAQMVQPFDPARSAALVDADGVVWGVVGEYKASVRRALKLPVTAAGFEIDSQLLAKGSPVRAYQPLSRFPSVKQDLTLKVASNVSFATLHRLVDAALGTHAPDDSHVRLESLDIYRQDGEDTKNVTFRITITGHDRTLTDKAVSSVVDAIAADAMAQLGAELV